MREGSMAQTVKETQARAIYERVPLYLALLGYGTLLGLAVGGWLLFVSRQPSLLEYAYRYDFLNVYVGASAVWGGQGAQLYDLDTQRRLTDAAIAPLPRPALLPYTYPGYVAVLLAPLAALPYPAAFVLWGLGNLAVAGVALGRLVTTTTQAPATRVALGLAAAACTPLLLSLLHGQFGLWPLLGLTEALLALRAGHERRAGAWLLLTLFKPQLIFLPLLALLLNRRWRTLIVFGACTAGVLALSLAVLGNWLPGYLALLDEFTRQGAALGNYPGAMHNWRGLVTAWLGADSTPPALTLWLGLSVLSLAAVVALWWRRPAPGPAPSQPAPLDDEARFALTILLGLLAAPHLYLHDVVLALPAAFLLWRASASALAALPPGAPAARRLHLLRWLLGFGSLAALLAQISIGSPIPVGPLYLTALVLTSLWALPLIPQAPKSAATA